MPTEVEKVFRAHWLVKAFPFGFMILEASYLLTAPGNITLEGGFIFGFYFLLCVLLAVYVFTTRLVFTEEAVRGENLLLGSSVVPYTEIERLESSHLYFIVQVYRRAETDPSLSIGIGYKGLQELVTELVKRAPEDVEIIDPMGRLRSVVEEDFEG